MVFRINSTSNAEIIVRGAAEYDLLHYVGGGKSDLGTRLITAIFAIVLYGEILVLSTRLPLNYFQLVVQRNSRVHR